MERNTANLPNPGLDVCVAATVLFVHRPLGLVKPSETVAATSWGRLRLLLLLEGRRAAAAAAAAEMWRMRVQPQCPADQRFACLPCTKLCSEGL